MSEQAGFENFDTTGVVTGITKLTGDGADAMQRWSDERRKDYSTLFQGRSNASQYILIETAKTILEEAARKHYIGQKKYGELLQKHNDVFKMMGTFVQQTVYNQKSRGYETINPNLGGRSDDELDRIASERAHAILDSLPPLKTAVQVIDPPTAEKMERIEELKKRAAEIQPRFEELGHTLRLSDVDQEMSIKAFRKTMKERNADHRKLSTELSEISKEGQELEDQVNKKLYSGIPELADEVVKVVVQHCERVTAMGAMSRRVVELVMFGDSKAATEMMQRFESDEAKVSPDIKGEFDKALERLKMSKGAIASARKSAKALKGKK